MAFEIPHHTQLLCQVSAKSADHNFWPLEHSPSQTVTFKRRARVYETWKQCQWIIGTLTCKHKISGENLWHLKPHLITFLVSNVLEGGDDINWWVISGLSSFLKELWSGFYIKAKCVGEDQPNARQSNSPFSNRQTLLSRNLHYQTSSFSLHISQLCR